MNTAGRLSACYGIMKLFPSVLPRELVLLLLCRLQGGHRAVLDDRVLFRLSLV